MTSFILGLMLSKTPVFYPKPGNPGVCHSEAACRRMILEINGYSIGGKHMGPKK